MTIKKWIIAIFTIILLIVGWACAGSIWETVEKGTYQVKQAAITGDMSVHMKPGLYWQNFGDFDVWPKAETYFFTHDNDTKGDVDEDTSIEVRFNDGSMCKISGTLRIIMPISDEQSLSLVTEKNHKTYPDLQEKLIKPTLRNVLRSTANLMSARESYSEKRPDFIAWSRDQITNGAYKTKEVRREVADLVTGQKTWKNVKVIKTEGDVVGGTPLYEDNPMNLTGIVLKNFEIKSFVYEKKVQAQISKQQEARMAVETAKAKAEEARQDELKAVAVGKKNVAIAKYEQEQEKIKAVVIAQKDKEVNELNAERDKNVAVIAGNQRKEVATLDRDAAKLKKQELILLGEGESKAKRLVIEADGALEAKLETYENVNARYADAIQNYRGNWVPTTVMGKSSGGNTNGATALIDLLTVKTAKDLSLDMNIKAGKTTK